MLVDPYAAVWSADTSGMNGAADIALGFVNCGEETGDANAGGGDFEGEQLDQGRVDTTLAVEREPRTKVAAPGSSLGGRIRTCYVQFLRSVSCCHRTRPLPIDPFPVRRPPKPPRVFFTRRTFAHAFSQKHTTRIPRTSPPASLPRRDMSNPGQLSSR